APAGLLQLKVNDRAVSANESGVFRAPIALGDRAASVSIVAIDNQGRRVVAEFTLVPEAAAGPAPGPAGPRPPPRPPPHPRLDFGRFHALVIGNNAYKQLYPLETAVADATEVGRALRDRYGYSVTLLTNATREQIIVALDGLRARLTE